MGLVEIKRIDHGTDLYLEEVALRRRVLREPLGLVFTAEQLDAESSDYHLVALTNGVVAGCLVLTPIDKDVIQMRQVAVEPAAQGLGIGRLLVEKSEEIAREQAFQEMMLHARDAAVGFYLRLGYELRGEPFIEVTIPHREMFKTIRL